MEKLLKVKDVCELLNVSKSTLYDWVHRGLVPHVIIKRNRVKQVVRFKLSEIEKFVKAQEKETRKFMQLDLRPDVDNVKDQDASSEEGR